MPEVLTKSDREHEMVIATAQQSYISGYRATYKPDANLKSRYTLVGLR